MSSDAAAPAAEDDLAPRHVHRATDAWHVEDGRVVLQVPKFGPSGTRVLQLLRIAPTARLRLDALASDAWHAFDGRTVADVVALLEHQHPEEQAIPQRLGAFVSRLHGRGLVTLTRQPPQS